MLEVDVVSLWNNYRGEFTAWLVPTGLLANFVYVRGRTRLSFLKAVVADVAMTALLWLLTVAAPLSVFAWELVGRAFPDGMPHGWANHVSWILVLLTSALIATASQSAVLRCFKHKVTKPGFGLLVLVNLFCLALATYRMVVYVLAHPPEA